MAIIKCKECGGDVSNKAAACPKCGAKVPPKTKIGTWIVAGIATFIVGSCVIDGNKRDQKTEAALAVKAAEEAQKTPEQKATEAAAKIKKEADFQRVLAGAKALKAASKDPSSFKLEGALMMPDGSICYEYRAKNSFNAIVPGQYVIGKKVQGESAAAWDKLCAGKTGDNYRHVRSAL